MVKKLIRFIEWCFGVQGYRVVRKDYGIELPELTEVVPYEEAVEIYNEWLERHDFHHMELQRVYKNKSRAPVTVYRIVW